MRPWCCYRTWFLCWGTSRHASHATAIRHHSPQSASFGLRGARVGLTRLDTGQLAGKAATDDDESDQGCSGPGVQRTAARAEGMAREEARLFLARSDLFLPNMSKSRTSNSRNISATVIAKKIAYSGRYCTHSRRADGNRGHAVSRECGFTSAAPRAIGLARPHLPLRHPSADCSHDIAGGNRATEEAIARASPVKFRKFSF